MKSTFSHVFVSTNTQILNMLIQHAESVLKFDIHSSPRTSHHFTNCSRREKKTTHILTTILLTPKYLLHPKIHAPIVVPIKRHRKFALGLHIFNRRVHKLKVEVLDHGGDGKIQFRVGKTIPMSVSRSLFIPHGIDSIEGWERGGKHT